MKLRLMSALAAAAALLTVLSAGAQTPKPAHHGLFGLFGHKNSSTSATHGMMGHSTMSHGMMSHGMMGHSAMGMHLTGRIIGNKKTHVYHLPGDTGNMPAPQNRVYFRSAAEAMRAGYHAAGAGGHNSMMSGRSSHSMMGHVRH